MNDFTCPCNCHKVTPAKTVMLSSKCIHCLSEREKKSLKEIAEMIAKSSMRIHLEPEIREKLEADAERYNLDPEDVAEAIITAFFIKGQK